MQDPLNQLPVALEYTFKGKGGSENAPSRTTDTLGADTASPFVAKDGAQVLANHRRVLTPCVTEFTVKGERPAPGTPSSRFGWYQAHCAVFNSLLISGEWHRPASKISQPPGGKSSNIFG